MKIVILLWLGFLSTAWARAVGDEAAKSDEGHKCLYNGKWYNEGDAIPTEDNCMSCTCDEYFDATTYTDCIAVDCFASFNPSCEPVYNESQCCPVAFKCDKVSSVSPYPLSSFVGCSCDKRYFIHYAVKGCTPVYNKPECDCPSHFTCPATPLKKDASVCTYKGKSYQLGDNIEGTNPCQICSCQPDYFTGATAAIKCIGIECPSAFGVHPEEGCYNVFSKDSCCPVGVKCPTPQELNEAKTCEHQGKVYRLGQHIYPEEDSCLTCLCSEDWTGVNERSCRTRDCMLERKARKLEEGCVPIYHEKTCCPIEFYCGTGSETLIQNGTVPLTAGSPENTCTFNGKKYRKGDVIDIHHPTHCVTCSCSTPPDITCVHISCPPPPGNDYSSCEAVYHPGQCCARYICEDFDSDAPVSQASPTGCDPVKCPPSCREMSLSNGCPVCECNAMLCSSPKCDPGCQIEFNVSPGTCPFCKCEDDSKFRRPLCAPVKCGPQCFEGVSPQGCPMCMCGPLCSPPKCEPHCRVQTDVPEGQCPGCLCPVQTNNSRIDLQVLCSPVKCAARCHEAIGQYGCPTCICDPMCTPPKCDPGCYLEMNPKYGPCPRCTCDGEEKLPTTSSSLYCAPVKCDPMCRVATEGHRCPTCVCDPLCSPPKCDPGCHIEFNPRAGPCPGCVCDGISKGGDDNRTKQKIVCNVLCVKGCWPVIVPNKDCPICKCGQLLCAPPQCAEGCEVEKNVMPGTCPGCKCPTYISMAQPMCRKPEECGPNCHKAVGELGCQYCICGPLCSPPKCGSDCYPQTNVLEGTCPGCECPSTNKNVPATGMPNVMCAPFVCPSHCSEVIIPNQCPFCKCSDILCSRPHCPDGCEIKMLGRRTCPGCECPSHIPLMVALCAKPPICNPGCHPATNSYGCRTCICGPLCSAPKCDAGCHIQTNVPDGTCPRCECPSTGVNLPNETCEPFECPLGCYKMTVPGHCPFCRCEEILCSRPYCPSECEILASPTFGACPFCRCPEGVPFATAECRALEECSPDCHDSRNSYGCQECICGPLCAPPECDMGCQLQTYVPRGPCPGCECSKGKTAAAVAGKMCAPVECPEGCHEVIVPNHCPFCKCGRRLCGQRCPVGCETKASANPDGCPLCDCPSHIAFATADCMPQPPCDPGCHEADGEVGCPTCVCGPICSPPKCKPGCHVQASVSNGACPECECPASGRISTVNLPKETCEPFECPLGCFKMTIPGHCPFCRCGEILCSRPKCPSECEILASPTFGACPFCRCPEGVPFATPDCRALEECSPDCHDSRNSYGCQECICGSLCAPPECDMGCQLQTYVPRGPCPGCECSKGKTAVAVAGKMCAPVECPEGCHEVIVPNHCPFCKCGGRLCGQRCPVGCEIKASANPDVCPLCDCPSHIAFATADCMPQPPCDPGCHQADGEVGCPTCVCGPICSPPKCQPGCYVQASVSSGACPECECPASGIITTGVSGVICEPIQCPLGCDVVIVPNHCPFCKCGKRLCAKRCPAGCEIEANPNPDTCPLCKCPSNIAYATVDCVPQQKCDPGCHEADGSSGCPTCVCGPLCSPPKCGSRCSVQTNVPAGVCPGCECPGGREDTKGVRNSNVMCSPVHCPSDCVEVIVSGHCPFCKCGQILCSQPNCPAGCKIQKNVAPGACPNCECPPEIPIARPLCSPVKCEPGCHEVASSLRCPSCICEPLCSPPKCGPGCFLQNNVPSGVCPGCECPSHEIATVQCSPVKCGPLCKEATGQHGCPTCICDPQCSPPKCDPGCRIEYDPAAGPCPGCVCDDHSKIQCSPVKCGPLCREATGQHGCPTCLCDPQCSPPKCDPGCRIEYDPAAGPCPGCVCDDSSLNIQCSPVKCGPMCRVVPGPRCPTCQCDPLCSSPQCEPGCRVEYNPLVSPCPACACGTKKGRFLNCPPLRCELPCRQVRLSPTVCPTCVCIDSPLCAIPQCKAGCRVEVVPPDTCPTCVCDKNEETYQCAPVKCGPNCREATGRYGCPSCLCDPLCSPPVCDGPGCRISYDPSLGPCPACVCD